MDLGLAHPFTPDKPQTTRLRGLARAFPIHKKRVPRPSRVLGERAGLFEAFRDRNTRGL